MCEEFSKGLYHSFYFKIAIFLKAINGVFYNALREISVSIELERDISINCVPLCLNASTFSGQKKILSQKVI